MDKEYYQPSIPSNLNINVKQVDEIYEENDLFKKGYLSIDTEICQQTYTSFREQLLWVALVQKPKEIRVDLVSPGGNVFHGFAIYDIIRAAAEKTGIPINTYGYGYMASMGSIIFQAGTKRYMATNAMYMIHQVSTFSWGEEKTPFVEDEAKLLKRLQKKMIDIYTERSILSRKKIESNWERKDWWLDSEQMLELGLVDEILDTRFKKDDI